jgi:ATP-dependent exoDNAse (exonuclease V) alpha subunit
MEINQVIHTEMQARGQVDHREERLNVLVARQEITGVDRQWAEQYQPGDIVRYTKGSKTHGIKAGEYARVEKIDAKENLVSVKKRTGKQVTYDPRRLQGVTLYREADRAFSRGDRVQFTAPDREQHIANRELASVEKIDRKGNIRLRLDSGRSVAFNIKENPHLDYGYAVTSHSSQGQTADRVLVHVDTEQASEKLVNRRLAYVAVSRGRYDAQIYTNDKTQLAEGLGRDVSRRTATQPHRESAGPAKRESPELELERERDRTQTQSYDIGR